MQRALLLDFSVYIVVRLLICLVQAMRLETGHTLAKWLAWLMCDVLRVRGKVVKENLALAFPNLSLAQHQALARQMWEHLFLLVLEVAHAPRKIHETNWRDYIVLSNHVALVRQMLSGRPTLIVTAHFGNFELAGVGLGILGFPTYTVARTLDNPFLDRFVNRFRGMTGQHIIPKNGGYEQIERVLGRGGTMTFLADQYAGKKGCWVDFFGRPASAHKAIGLLALEHEAPVAVCDAPRMDRPLRIKLEVREMIDPRDRRIELANVRALTQWYTKGIEDFVRATPGQYWWLHRRWKDTRKPKQVKKAA